MLSTAWDSIANGRQTDVIYTDFQSAFQSVNHQLLIHKLHKSYCINGLALSWFRSFLSDRKQRVVVNGKCSSWQDVLSGTPEGSVISPLLFALFVNDFPLHVQTKCLMFADDIKVYSEISDFTDTARLQGDIKRLYDWSKTWKMKLNPSKCKQFCITLKSDPITCEYMIGDTRLEIVHTIRDLGVVLDRRLTFCNHIDFIVSRANKVNGIVMRSMQSGSNIGILNWKSILTAFYGNVRALLEYCCVIWGGAAKSHLDRIERVQIRFLRWRYYYVNRRGAPSYIYYSRLLQAFVVTHLEKRRHQYDIVFVEKLYKGVLDSPLLLSRFPLYAAPITTRRIEGARGVINVPFARVDTVKGALFVRAATIINNFMFDNTDVDLFHDSMGEFRAKVRLHTEKNM